MKLFKEEAILEFFGNRKVPVMEVFAMVDALTFWSMYVSGVFSYDMYTDTYRVTGGIK